MKRYVLIVVLIIVLIYFLSYVLDFNQQRDLFTALFGATTFIFGTLSAFYISMGTTRQQNLITLLKESDGRILSIFNLLKVFPRQEREQTVELIDQYLIAQIDYELKDFDLSYPQFGALFEQVQNLNTGSEKEKEAYSLILDNLNELSIGRQKIGALVNAAISKIEWIILISLEMIMIVSLVALNSANGLSFLIVMLLVMTSLFILELTYRIDTLNWKEQHMIWEPLQDLFVQIGRLPYLPQVIIKKGRAVLKYSRVRVAYYDKRYPDLTGKKVIETGITKARRKN